MLITGIDKGARIRMFQVIYFFFRRFIFCYCMATETLSMRYTIIVFFTVFGVVWTNGLRPYKEYWLNLYMGAMELLYLSCLVFFIVFTDIMPEISAKVICSIIFFVIVCSVMILNLAYSIYIMMKDRSKYKEDVQAFKRERLLISFER